MSYNPLAQVKDYQSMLNRIFLFSVIWASVVVWLLRSNWTWLNQLLSNLDLDVEIGPVKKVRLLGYLLPGAVIALAARAIRLHDRVSDVLKVRLRFDVEQILRPLAEGSGFPTGQLDLEQLRSSRSQLMRPAFYRYASSTKPVIDTHLIYEALDWWSWYWVLVEGVALFLPAGIALLFLNAYVDGLIVLGSCLVVVVIVLPCFRSQCARYAKAEVDEILSDPTRKAEIRQLFEALHS